MGGSGGSGALEAYDLMKQASEAENPYFRDRVMFQTYHQLTSFRPKEYMEMIRTSVMHTLKHIPILNHTITDHTGAAVRLGAGVEGQERSAKPDTGQGMAVVLRSD